MGFFLGSIAATIALTVLTAWLLVRRRPAGSATTQILGAAMSFPALAVVLFAIATTVALVGAADAPRNQGAGMAVFAMIFFLFYAIVIGAVIGIPTAIVSVRAFRRR